MNPPPAIRSSAFTSRARRGKKVGVAGTVWLRRDPLDLVSVDYKYTNLERALQRANPGGSIHFRPMPNGITMVNAWRIRGATQYVPAPTGPQRVVLGRPGSARPSDNRRRLTPWRHRMKRAQSSRSCSGLMFPTYIAPMASVSGVAIDKLSSVPLANALVRFERTPFKAVTDSTGAFTILDVLPGVYAADIGEPELLDYGVEGPLIGPLAIKFGPNTGLRLVGEGPASTVARGCDRNRIPAWSSRKRLAGRTPSLAGCWPESSPPGSSHSALTYRCLE